MRHILYPIHRGLISLLVLVLLSALTFQSQAQSGSVTTTQSFSYTGQIVTYTVPAGVTSLTIEARGAEGGDIVNKTVPAGKGAIVSARVSVTPGQSLSILAGQQLSGRAGGGGGSFVVAPSSTTAPTPLVIAGGGGGAGFDADSSAKHGQLGSTGGIGVGGGEGGTNGQGGGSSNRNSGGGGGLLGDGRTSIAGTGGRAFINGGAGGTNSLGNGGFGGGGGGGSTSGGGGGGGYSGGGGGNSVGGGGGSFSAGTPLFARTGATDGNSGNGLVIITYTITPPQPIRYVKQGGTGDGSSWTNASGDLQSQIDIAGAQQVWVAAGTYKPGPAGNTDRSISFVMKNGVAIYGGFPADNFGTLANRKPASFTTVLSGDIDGDGALAGNSLHVIYNSYNGLDNTAVLDGFVITAGNASGGIADFSDRGAGMYNVSASPTLINLIFINNSAANYGAAVYVEGNGNSRFINCVFSQNGQTAVFGYLNSTINLVNCTLSQNSGGAIDVTGGSTASLTNCIVWNNGGPGYFNGAVTANYCLIGTGEVNYSGIGNVTATTSPFVSATDLRLNPCSPAINAGDPNSTTATSGSTDRAGNPRFYQGGRIDIGAYEYQGTPAQPVAITRQPVSGSSVCAGGTVTAMVSVTGTSPAYQWYKGSALVSGQTSPTLTLTNVQTSDSGSYSVVVTSSCNSLTSSAFSLTVNALPSVRINPASQTICQGQSASLTAQGATTYQWSTGQTSPSISVSMTGTYSVTGTTSGCSATATASLTVNPVPQAPLIATQSGHSYPGGVSSLTISQNVGNVILMVSGCMGGTITWAGGSSNTLAVSTMNTGRQTFTATCTQNGCASPPATATVTVIPTTLSVLHRDGNGQINTNTLAPYLQLQNDGNTAIPYQEITVRYWLTVENYAPLQFQINYAQLGSDKVHLKYVPAATGNPKATGYIEFSFDASAGSLGAMSNSGPIQDLINKQDYSYFDQSNDYSYAAVGQFTPNNRITAYRNGVLFYGLEPGPVVPMQSVKAMLQNNTGDGANTIEAVLSVTNDGNVPINYGDLKVRYYFTADNNQPLVLSQTGYTALGSGNVSAQIVTINPALAGADRYLELSFSPSLGQLAPGASTGGVTYQIRHADYSGFTQSNDYSYQGTGGTMVNPHVVVFVAGQRAYGTEPTSGARQGVEEAGKLAVAVLGNPVTGASLSVSVRGAEGQALRYELTDVSGHVVGERQVESAGSVDEQSLSVGHQPAGLLLLRVSTPTQSQTVKVLRQ